MQTMDFKKVIITIAIVLIPLLLAPQYLLAHSLKPFIYPMEGDIVTGFREKYWDQEKEVHRRHTGIDIKNTPGTRVRASANGRVAYIGISPIGGLTLVLEHNYKIRTTYLNLQYIMVSRGQYVFQGQDIALIGARDDPSHAGAHLHFGVIYDGAYLNPQDLLSIDYSSISRFIYLQFRKDDHSLSPDYIARPRLFYP